MLISQLQAGHGGPLRPGAAAELSGPVWPMRASPAVSRWSAWSRWWGTSRPDTAGVRITRRDCLPSQSGPSGI